MNVEQIPFDEVKNQIEKIFSTSPNKNWNLLPDDIHNLAKQAGKTLQWTKIDWWTSFEYGHMGIDDETFFKILFKQIRPTDNKVIIVTDECFKNKLAYCIDTKDLEKFANNIYPEIHDMEFFQPSDFIFVFPTQKLLTILHHEGYVMQFHEGE